MRFSAMELTPKRMLSEQEAGSYVGCDAWLRSMVQCGWLRSYARGKIKRYDIEDLDAAVLRFKSAEGKIE